MNRATFNSHIQQANFRELFITEMGWNNPRGQVNLPTITVDEIDYNIKCIAERNGFQILTCQVQSIPTMTMCRKIDIKLRRQANDYICIYILSETEHHEWVAPVRTSEKRDIVLVEYCSHKQADFLFSKIAGLSFALDEVTTIVDVRERIQNTFAVNSEKITKDFYAGFKKEHTAFANFITGLDDTIPTKDNKNKQWYTSVMLNRLMFCYFIEKKGFLNNNTNYLRDKLDWVRQEKGADRFFSSFYRGFLIQLFHDGLNTARHDREFEKIYGRIPYLNGGMFENHQLEQEYADIDISDEAFVRLFDFFDTWEWHLDTRITASGKDINPDVLGYIFEQYINDRAAMGAYYTKEDITDYIGKNCIIPFLFDKVAQTSSRDDFRPDGYVWEMVKSSDDHYIYDAVKRGFTPDWMQHIPTYIAEGIDTEAPNLLERRSRWNEKTDDAFALPTEIWRETIERLQRCESIIEKIKSGEILQINDFITYNLDIRQFAYDLILNATDHRFVGNFYHALQSVSILDPTCGSGAFLFAAMNILEPLYEVCISRMQEFNAQNNHLFKTELGEIANKYRSNIQYFIYKSIILRNLYGVDIMVEATEIAKLRLFLKMVAVVEVDKRADNLGLDPLPDIDFNIRCGNTLVGFANEEQLNKELEHYTDFHQQIANQEFAESIKNMMDVVARTYEVFKDVQLNQTEDRVNYKEAKEKLKTRLYELNELLNQRLFKATADTNKPYEDWLASHQPFHWLAEFYQIIHGNNGFDVIIGNPPYVEYNKKDKTTKKAVSDIYKLNGYKTIDCGNLYAFVMERSKSIINNYSFIGMIVPLSGHSTERMAPLVKYFYESFGLHLHLNLSADAHPQKLFEGVKFRLSIFFASNQGLGVYSTKYKRWYAEERKVLFQTIVFNSNKDYHYNNIISKIPSNNFLDIISKINLESSFFYTNDGKHNCLYHNAPINWVRSHSFVPYFKSDRDGEGVTTQLKCIGFSNINYSKIASSILNSSLFFITWIANSDCYHLNKQEISNFKINIDNNLESDLCVLSDKLSEDMLKKSIRRVYNYQTSGRVEYDEFYMKLSKPIIDEIDKVLAKHYGFTEEELDFIINYDIKYRMGDELNDND